MEPTHKVINENPDSIEIGTPSKGGTIKVYGDFGDMERFEQKIANAIKLRAFTQARMSEAESKS